MIYWKNNPTYIKVSSLADKECSALITDQTQIKDIVGNSQAWVNINILQDIWQLLLLLESWEKLWLLFVMVDSAAIPSWWMLSRMVGPIVIWILLSSINHPGILMLLNNQWEPRKNIFNINNPQDLCLEHLLSWNISIGEIEFL